MSLGLFIVFIAFVIIDVALFMYINKVMELVEELTLMNSKILNILGQDFIERKTAEQEVKENDK